jgi:hypothetical protein
MGDRRAGFTVIEIIRSGVTESRERCPLVTREEKLVEVFSSTHSLHQFMSTDTAPSHQYTCKYGTALCILVGAP